MRIFNSRPLFLSAIFLCAGIIFAGSIQIPPFVCIISVFVLLILFFTLLKFKVKILIFLAVFCLGMFLISDLKTNNDDKFISEKMPACARICEDPEIKSASTITLTLDSVYYKKDGLSVSLYGRTTVNIPNNENNLELKYNDLISFSGNFNKITKNQNWYLSNRLNFKSSASDVKRIGFYQNDVYYYILKLRQATSEIISRLYPTNISSVVAALITGDKVDVPDSTLNAFRVTGISHLLAVSGLHLGIITALVFFILKALRLPYKLRYILAVLSVFIFAALAGFSPSVSRAGLMCVSFLTAKLIRKHTDMLSVMGFACILLLLINPASVFSLGFQLSFAALYGITAVTPYLSSSIKKLIRKPKYLIDLFSASTGAVFATSPIIAYVYGTFCIVGIIFNLIAVPLGSIAVILSAISVLSGLIFIPLGEFVAFINSYVILALDFLTKKVAEFPFCQIPFPNVNFITIVLFFLMAFAVSPYCLLKKRQRRYLFSIFAVLSVFSVLIKIQI